MSWTVAAATLATACSAVVATALLDWRGGLLVGVVVAAGAAAMVAWRRRTETTRLADNLRGWAATGDGPEIAVPADPDLADLVAVLTEVAAGMDERLRRAEQEPPWRRELVAALPTAAVLFGPDGYLGAANRPARDLLGIAADGAPVTVLKALGSASLADAVRSIRDDDPPVEVDAEVSGRVVRAVVTTIGAQRLVLVTDRTRERRLENLRRNFVVNASHELKTPVTSIQALAEALAVMVDRDPARLPPLLDRLGEESTRLVRMVHDLLDLRRLEDRIHLDPEPIDVVPVVAEAAAGLSDAATEHDITVVIDLPEQAFAHCDPDDLRIVVRNLLGNAVQYNRDEGRLEITVQRLDDVIELTVTDTGIGIPKADLSRVFERFYRVDVARSRQTGGTGLGLSLVRNAVTRNGGTIELESLLGSGSTFTVRLPAARPRPRVSVERAADPDDHVALTHGPQVPDALSERAD